MNPLRRGATPLVLTVVAILGLAYDAKVHLHLAPNYDSIGTSITQGALFRVEAAAAIVVALALVVFDHRFAWAAAGLVGLGGVVAVVLYRYVQVPAIGPIPSMYEPAWYAEKSNSAVAEAAVFVLALAREALRRRTRLPVSAGSTVGSADPAGPAAAAP